MFQVDEQEIEGCCWVNYSAMQDKRRNLTRFDTESEACSTINSPNKRNKQHQNKSKWSRKRREIWEFLDNPQSSKKAKVIKIYKP